MGNVWRNSTDLDAEPNRMPFTPTREPGFQLPRGQNWSPFDLFSLFFSRNSIDVIVNNTNKFGNKLKSDKSYFRWFQLTSKEFLAFLGIVIFMGLVEVPSLPEYWNDDGFFGQDFVRASGMNRTRFMNILTALHLCDLEQDRDNEIRKARKEPYDPLFKLKPFMNDLQIACKSYFVPATGREMVARGKGKLVGGRYVKDQVNIPPAVKGYNANMGGVDLSDQLLKCYEIIRKSKKWWKTLFLHFIDVAIVNSFLIYKEINGELNHKMYRVNLAKSLLIASEMQANPSPGPGRPQNSDVRAEHCPVAISNENLDQKATKASLGRKNCKLCYSVDNKQMKTPWQCSKCKISLCLQLDRNCFQRWHSAECDNLR